MKFAVSTYSFGEYASRGVPYMIDEAARLGFDGIEFCLDGGFTDGELSSFGRRARDAGLAAVCSAVGADFLRADPKEEIKRLAGEVRRASLLGVPLMRHDASRGLPGKLSDGDFSDALPALADCCREVSRYAAGLGVRTCVENHGYFCQDADRVVALVRATDDGNFGALCDVGNFMCADEYPPDSAAKVAPYVFHVHAKDFYLKKGAPAEGGWFPTRGGDSLLGAAIGDGDAGAKKSLDALRAAGYDGFVTVEYEGADDNLLGIARGLGFLKKHFAK